MSELLYQKSKVVAGLNKVEGFEPLELARKIEQEGQEPQLYLDVKYRKLWFRLVYPAGKIVSRILNFTENMALAEARIYLDRNDNPENYIANSFSQKFRSDDPKFGDKFLEMAETAAIGRALADAGFGVQFADVSEGNDPNQVDAGIPVPEGYQNPQPSATMPQPNPGHPTQESFQNGGGMPQEGAVYPFAPGNQPSGQGQIPVYPGENRMNQFYRQAQAEGSAIGTQNQNPSIDGTMPVDELVKRMTYEQAVQVTIGGKGKFGGKTMGQVAVESPSSVEYFANNYSGRNNLIPAAARIILNRALPMAG